MKIKKPIFIIGSGRSGTSLLYNILATHKSLAFITNLTNAYPKMPWLAFFNRLYNTPIIGAILKKSLIKSTKNPLFLNPNEGENIYSYCGFKDSQKMTVKDLRKIKLKVFKKVISDHVLFSGTERFLAKRTATTQRLGLINLLFPDAYYIHIIRDGRAVSESLTNTPWWPSMNLWWTGKKVSELIKKGYSSLDVAAMHWQKNIIEIEKSKTLFRNRYLEISYENLTSDTHGTLAKVLKFCELSASSDFFDHLPKSMDNMNYKWEKKLSLKEKADLKARISLLVKKLGYKW